MKECVRNYAVVPAHGHSGNVTHILSAHRSLAAAKKQADNSRGTAKYMVIARSCAKKGARIFLDTVKPVYWGR